MGRMAIISALTLVFALAIIGYNINRRSTDAVNNYVGYYDYTCARDIATSAVEIYLLKLKENPTLRGAFSISSIMGGSAVVNIVELVSGTLDTLRMTSVGTYNTVVDTVINKLGAVPITIPPISGAVGMSTGRSASIKISGNAQTSGVDKNLNGTPVSPADSVAGIAINLTSPSGNISVAATATVTGNGSISPDTERVASLPVYFVCRSDDPPGDGLQRPDVQQQQPAARHRFEPADILHHRKLHDDRNFLRLWDTYYKWKLDDVRTV